MAVNVWLCEFGGPYQGVEILVSLFQTAQHHILQDHNSYFLVRKYSQHQFSCTAFFLTALGSK
jgi:hypothetical protein